jgi:hypothetical protein
MPEVTSDGQALPAADTGRCAAQVLFRGMPDRGEHRTPPWIVAETGSEETKPTAGGRRGEGQGGTVSKTKRNALDEALYREIKNNGPILLWVGEEYPGKYCRFRGLELGKVNLSEWIEKHCGEAVRNA